MEQQAWLRINRKILKSAVTSNLSPHYSQGGSSFAALGTNRLMFTGHHPFYEESVLMCIQVPVEELPKDCVLTTGKRESAVCQANRRVQIHGHMMKEDFAVRHK